MVRFLESPVPVLLVGLAVESLLLIFYLQTRRGAFFVAMVVIAALTGGGIVLEQVVVTDRETIENTVYDLAAALEANDVPAVLAFISPRATKVRQDAERAMNRYQIDKARIISDLSIEFFRNTHPPSARVEFRALVNTDVGGGAVQFTLHFDQAAAGAWRVSDYSYDVRN